MNLLRLRFTHPDNLSDSEVLMAASDLRSDHYRLRPQDVTRIVEAVRRRHDLTAGEIATLTGYPLRTVFRILQR
ncbi:MAG: hypothetical protein J0I34_33210 [Pseudonocardia sp.]|uniref:hypothetical protein n=1 Tax=unclassified Pseudonocardia TaxID=2619320 RepID=UPI00086ADB23|nr:MULTISPECIES: hypothetical protein [unclassified Pseudonocardia]MBN9113623.1 hypothetical protein [Pseudonocardia sp.]ODU13073.1 MAG: hypothetical protein ABS80_21705 [Pseudonocardia sp. SCN 72-51]ODU98799.1 MAG: hypothetical protein ABT15_33055 [Pseudonocardia sp. SCN 73-27]